MKATARILGLVGALVLAVLATYLWTRVSRHADEVGVQEPTNLVVGDGQVMVGSLAPDGSRVLLLKAGSSGTKVFENLDEYRASENKPSGSINLSTGKQATDRSNWSTPLTLDFCDHGRFLLVYVGNQTFLILDAADKHTLHSLAIPLRAKDGSTTAIWAGSCAADAPIAAIYSSGKKASLTVFDLQSGNQVKDIAAETRPDHLSSLDISPSGTKAAILFVSLPSDVPPRPASDLTVFDLNAGTVSAHIQTGMTGEQALFVGEGAVAVGSGTIRGSSDNTAVQMFRLDSGLVARRFGVPAGVAGAPIGASADGKFVMAYTGRESLKQDVLQIQRAQFTIWNAGTGAVVARSPSLNISTRSTAGWDLAPFSSVPKESIRPMMTFSQGGNAVLVTHPVYGGPVQNFSVTGTHE